MASPSWTRWRARRGGATLEVTAGERLTLRKSVHAPYPSPRRRRHNRATHTRASRPEPPAHCEALASAGECACRDLHLAPERRNDAERRIAPADQRERAAARRLSPASPHVRKARARTRAVSTMPTAVPAAAGASEMNRCGVRTSLREIASRRSTTRCRVRMRPSIRIRSTRGSSTWFHASSAPLAIVLDEATRRQQSPRVGIGRILRQRRGRQITDLRPSALQQTHAGELAKWRGSTAGQRRRQTPFGSIQIILPEQRERRQRSVPGTMCHP